MRPFTGIGLMFLAMLVIPISDGLIKLLSERYPILFLNWVRFVIGSIIFIPFALSVARSHTLLKTQVLALSMRTVLHVAAISLYFLAIARVPLADALGAYFVAPLVASALATILLGERITRVAIVALALGFVGAVTVVQPGGSTDVGMFYAIGSGIVFGIFLVLTRKASQTIPPVITLGFQCGFGALLLLPVGYFLWSPVLWRDIALIVAAGGIWAAGHYAIIHAFKRTSTTILAPLVYLEILGGAGVGYVLFGHIPNAMTIAGISLIICAGLLVQGNTATTISGT
ncbi:MAG: DMT family transporter [Gammaproteobacteria bacterium]|nr:DMT family transporter [Gammaproteobacteria bacterium]